MEQALIRDLEKLGLTQAESRVYLTALQSGGGYVAVIAKRAGVERTNCYHILKTLSKKGLISVADKGGRGYFLPESPQALLTEGRNRLLLVEKIVPSLLALENTRGARAPKIRSYEEREGSINVLQKTLESSTEILRYTNLEHLRRKFSDELRSFCKSLAKRKLRMRMVSSYHPEAEQFLEEYFPSEYYRTCVQLLFVNPREFSMENEVCVFDDKVTILSLSQEEHLGVIVESEVFAETSRTIFNLSWLGATTFDVQW